MKSLRNLSKHKRNCLQMKSSESWMKTFYCSYIHIFMKKNTNISWVYKNYLKYNPAFNSFYQQTKKYKLLHFTNVPHVTNIINLLSITSRKTPAL